MTAKFALAYFGCVFGVGFLLGATLASGTLALAILVAVELTGL